MRCCSAASLQQVWRDNNCKLAPSPTPLIILFHFPLPRPGQIQTLSLALTHAVGLGGFLRKRSHKKYSVNAAI